MDVQSTGRVPKSKSVVTSAYYGQKEYEKIELVHSQKYELQSLLDYMYKRWNLHHIKTYREQNACLLLFVLSHLTHPHGSKKQV